MIAAATLLLSLVIGGFNDPLIEAFKNLGRDENGNFFARTTKIAFSSVTWENADDFL